MDNAPTPELPTLYAVLGTAEDGVAAAPSRALTVLRELLGMQLAYVSEFRDGRRVLRHAVRADAQLSTDTTQPVEETLCHHVAIGAAPLSMRDTGVDPLYQDAALRGMRSYVCVPVHRAGGASGALCVARTSPDHTINDRDVAVARTVASYLGDTADRDGDVPAPTGIPALDVAAAAAAMASDGSVEAVTRPLLNLLQHIVGLESTYLTIVDWMGGEQRIAYSQNTGEMQIPEGLVVDWEDTLCRRSLDARRAYTSDVPAVWGDSSAARDLGIVTYVSVPVRDAAGGVVGTLCGASSRSADVDPAQLDVMHMFGRIISAELAREAARASERARAEELKHRARRLTDLASNDPLTGLRNRAGIDAWLRAVLPMVEPGRDQLALALVDVDRFKTVNDTYGHGTGDRVLRALATSLREVGRRDDLHGRIGGDEFVVAALLPDSEATLGEWWTRLQDAATVEVDGIEVTVTVGMTRVTDPGTTPAAALDLADQVMYTHKRRRGRAGPAELRTGGGRPG